MVARKRMKTDGAPQGAQAVLRALRLLKSFHRGQPERSLADLAAEHGLTRTTTHRLLAALESEGLVARSADSGAYRLGPATLALGVEALHSHGLRNRVRPLLERLALATGETATFEVLHDGMVLIVDEVPGPHVLSSAGHVGTRWPLHATSTGKVLLAFQGAAPRELRRPLAAFTRTTITDPDTLERELARVRDRGYATVIGELEEGFNAVAVPVRDAFGEVAGALSLGGSNARLGRRELTQLAASLQDALRDAEA